MFRASVLGHLFQCDPDIRIARSEMYLDRAEPRKIGIISHGNADHIGRHEHFIATPPTAAFLRARSEDQLKGTELAYRTKHYVGEWSVEALSAGQRPRVGHGPGTKYSFPQDSVQELVLVVVCV
jgi:Cft2 family RNA processing exonuclease